MAAKLKVFFRHYSDIIILALSGGLLFFAWQPAENYFTPFYKNIGQLSVALKSLSLLYGVVVLGKVLSPLITLKIGLKYSLSLGFLSYPLFIFAILTQKIFLLYPLAILLGLGAGIKSNTELAYLGAVSPKDKRGNFSGFYWAITRIGATFGLIFSSFFLIRNNFLYFYFVLLGLALLATILLFIFLKEPPNYQKVKNSENLFKTLKEIFQFIFNRKVLLLSPDAIAGGFIFGLITAKIPITIQSLYGASWVGVLLLIFQITRAVLTHPFGIISDKVGRFNMKYLEILIAVLGAALYLLSKNIFILIVTLFTFGINYAIQASNDPALFLDLFEDKIQLSSAASSIIKTVGGIIPGFLLSAIKSDNYLITVAIGLSLIGLISIKLLEKLEEGNNYYPNISS